MKKKESSGELDFLRYFVKGRSAGGNLLAKMSPAFEKCLVKILGVREESLVRLLLLSRSFNLPTDLHFLLERIINPFMPRTFFFILFKLSLKRCSNSVSYSNVSTVYNVCFFSLMDALVRFVIQGLENCLILR